MDCEHKRVEEGEGYVFCVECGLEIEKFFGYSYSGFKKKEKKILLRQMRQIFFKR